MGANPLSLSSDFKAMLEHIQSPLDLKGCSLKQLEQLCADIRQEIIRVMSQNPGHFGASMGVVELTVMLHHLLDTPSDQLVWDVGHQCYPHKLLTGRKNEFDQIRKKDGPSGFPSIKESVYDSFGTGHSSTAIGAALGMAEAHHLQQSKTLTVAIVGDGALTGGMAFEALNNASLSKSNLLIVFNDNGMSIDDNVGALQQQGYEHFFRSLGLSYNGPIDGHDLTALRKALLCYQQEKGVAVWHIKTVKGKGYTPAEQGSAVHWHAPGTFHPASGKSIKSLKPTPPKYQDVFGATLVKLAKNNPKVVGITPAMATGSGMTDFAQQFPNRFFDVGIAEQHAVTFSAGLAKSGMIPFCNIYSTFFQRGYDQLIHDVALQKLPVIFCLDRAGIAGNDGPTHQGAFDLAYLNCIPNLTILAPIDELELSSMMEYAIHQQGPVVIRYPRGRGKYIHSLKKPTPIKTGIGTVVHQGKKVALLNLGHLGNQLENLTHSMDFSLYNLRFLKPLDEALIQQAFDQHEYIITLEDGTKKGGLYASICIWKNERNYTNTVYGIGLPDTFIEHGSQKELYAQYKMDVDGIEELLRTLI